MGIKPLLLTRPQIYIVLEIHILDINKIYGGIDY